MKNNFKLFVPNPHGKDIGKTLLKKILNDLRISEKDFWKRLIFLTSEASFRKSSPPPFSK